jgi:membrane-bound metal-dependent hydrolase YbcI (DUF457 family)
MPVTPLHYCAAYITNKAKVGLVLPALIVGSVIPDVEPFVGFVTNGMLVPSRGLMHSLLGAVTLDTFLALLVTMFLYPVIVSWIFKLKKKDVVEKCRFSGTLVLSALIGSLSHVLIDSTMHEYNPLLYPFMTESFDAFVLMSNWFSASIIVHSVLLGLLLAIFFREIRRGTERLWERLLVG